MTTFFIETLKKLSHNNDRYIKGHSVALLKRLQSLTPQDYD